MPGAKTSQQKPATTNLQQKNVVSQPKKVEPTKTLNQNKIVQEQPKKTPTVTTAASPNATVSTTNQKAVPPTVTKPKQETNKPQPVYNPNSVAMIDYKTKLRAKLFSKFAVTNVQGAGTCTIQFSVDKSGKLINRKFTKESTNKTLNDTVYYMLMSVPTFTAPPDEYNGSLIYMTFTVNYGNFEISIN